MMVFSGLIFGQSTYQKMSDLTQVKSDIAKASQKLKSIEATFSQTKKLLILDEDIKSSGTFDFRSPEAVRWEYKHPFFYLIIIRNGVLTIKDDKKQNEIKMESNPVFRQINSLMMSTIKGDILLNKDFDSEAYQNSENYKITLKPLDANMKEFIDSIELIMNKKDLLVKSINITEPMGDYTFISFTYKQINANIPDSRFQCR